MAGILWFIIVAMVIFWALGFALHIGGGLIHLLLVVALIALVFNTQDQVFAWFRVDMTAEEGYVESCAVISGANQEDQLCVVVRRTVNGRVCSVLHMVPEFFGELRKPGEPSPDDPERDPGANEDHK